MGISRSRRLVTITLAMVAGVTTLGVYFGIMIRNSKTKSPSTTAGSMDDEQSADNLFPDLWPHEVSDVAMDPDLHVGTLKNGMRYMILPHRVIHTPAKTAVSPPETPGTLSIRLHVQAGSLQENDDQLGLAHFTEHMLFNGLKSFSADELIKSMQRHGIEFGSHASAKTAYDHTIYMLDLPNTDIETQDIAFAILRDFCDGALFLPDEIEKERGVVLSELNTRDSIQSRILQSMLEKLIPDHLLSARPILGKREYLEKLARADFISFYQKYYVPSRMTLVVVGNLSGNDSGVPVMENRILSTFSSVKRVDNSTEMNFEGSENVYGSVPKGQGFQAYVIHEPEAAFDTVYLYKTNPYSTKSPSFLDTKDARTRDLSLRLADVMLTNRFQTIMQKEDAPIAWGASDSSIWANSVDFSWIQVVLTPENNNDTHESPRLVLAVETMEQELRRLLTFGFQEPELELAKANLAQQFQEAADGAQTQTSATLADELIKSVLTRSVFSAPQENLRLVEEAFKKLTLTRVNDDFIEHWNDEDVSLIYITSNTTSANEDHLANIYAQSLKVPVTPESITENEMTAEGNTNEFAYKSDCFGPSPGTINTENFIEDLQIREIVLSNNVRVNLKITDFEDNKIMTSARFGTGQLGQPMNTTGLDFFTERLINDGGLGLHSKAELNQILAGKAASSSMTVEDDSFLFEGETSPAQLKLQLQLLCAHLSDPGYRPEAVRLFRNDVPPWMSDLKHSLAGPYQQIKAALKGNDDRFAMPSEKGLMDLEIEDAKNWIDAQLKDSYLEVSLVGDLPDSSIDLILETLGALPSRSLIVDSVENQISVQFPEPPQTMVYTYESSQLDQAAAVVAWEVPSMPGGAMEEIVRLEILEKIFEDKMRVEIREQMGKVYGYSARLRLSDGFDYGEFTALCLVESSMVASVGMKMIEIGQKLAVDGLSDDELVRALEPLLMREEADLVSNSYWSGVLEKAQAKPYYLERARARKEIYTNSTTADIQDLATKYLLPELSVRFEAFPVEADKPSWRLLRGISE